MAKELNYGQFMKDHDMVLCNNVTSFPLEYEFEVPKNFEPYQYFLTNFSENDVEYFKENYGLKFAYCEELDLYVFLNDICFGMSFDDVVLKPLKQTPTMEDLDYFRDLLLEVSRGMIGLTTGCIEHYNLDYSAIMDEPTLLEFAEEFVKELHKLGFEATILKDKHYSNRVDTYCAVVFGNSKEELVEPLDYMLSKGCYELMQEKEKK